MYSSPHRQARWLSVLFAILSILLLGTMIVSAQGDATPLTIGENRVGEISVAASSSVFTIQVGAPQSVNVQVLAITPNFLPSFRILDPSGIVIMNAINNGIQTSAAGMPNLSGSGVYRIEVSGTNNSTGQFLISVQPGAPLAPPQPLTPGQPLSGVVSAQTTRQAFSFNGSSSDVLLLTVRSGSPNADPTVTLRDAETGELLALNSARLAGVRYRIGTGNVNNYLVEVSHSGVSTQETFSICLELENGTTPCGSSASAPATPTPQIITVITATPTITVITATPMQPPTASHPVIDPNGACMVASASGATINVRSGPGLSYNIVSHLSPTMTAPVYGRMPDNSWVQVNVNGVIGWMSTTVVVLGGNCSGVPVVIPPTLPPTPTATATTLPPPTAAPTSSGGGVIMPLTMIAPIPTLAIIQPIVPHLDYTANANYGTANLTSGFVPDPYSVSLTSGGPVDVSYLGSACSGFATASPDLKVIYSSGAFPLLRFYFAGTGDTTMVVNDPNGNFHCVDDSFGTINPTIDFNNPASGTYDVWIGSYSSGAYVSGTLYVTENTGNHP